MKTCCSNLGCLRSLDDKKLPCWVCCEMLCTLCATCCQEAQRILDHLKEHAEPDTRSLKQRIDDVVNQMLLRQLQVSTQPALPTNCRIEFNPAKMTIEGETFEVPFEPMEFAAPPLEEMLRPFPITQSKSVSPPDQIIALDTRSEGVRRTLTEIIMRHDRDMLGEFMLARLGSERPSITEALIAPDRPTFAEFTPVLPIAPSFYDPSPDYVVSEPCRMVFNDGDHCGNCGTYRAIKNGVLQKCSNCGDDETDLTIEPEVP